MTTTVTEREILSSKNGRVPALDSPAVSTRARARIPVTQRVGNAIAVVRVAASRWWAFTARPLSLRATWRLSAVDEKRIPAKSRPLRVLWAISNATDRPLLFVLLLLAPTLLTGPLRWAATRPTRRWGLYLSTSAMVAVWLLKGE